MPPIVRTHPAPTYYSVIDVWRIISDPPIIPDPINQTIPFKALKYRGPVRDNPNPSAMADSAAGKHDGSALWRGGPRLSFRGECATRGQLFFKKASVPPADDRIRTLQLGRTRTWRTWLEHSTGHYSWLYLQLL